MGEFVMRYGCHLCSEITVDFFKIEDARAKDSVITSRYEVICKLDRHIDDAKQYGGISTSSVCLSLQNHD